jgi:hypothetical protein
MSKRCRIAIRKIVIALISISCLAAGSSGQAIAQSGSKVDNNLDALFGDHRPYQQFFEGLKKVVAEGDKEAVAAMVGYPFRTRIEGAAVEINDQSQFVENYDQFITIKVKNALATQTYETLFVTRHGVMIGSGEIWFGAICEDAVCGASAIRIMTINN